MIFERVAKGMVLAGGVLLALATNACVESQLEPRAPDAVVLAQPGGGKLWVAEGMPAVGAEDSFWRVAAPETRPSRPYVPAKSISLGFIGDEPIGANGQPTHYEPSWTRPFPASWTRSYYGGRGYYGGGGRRW